MEEIWKTIKGYENYYQISNQGRVKSVTRFVNDNNGVVLLKSKILNPMINEKGYLRIGLSKNNQRKYKRIHRLVAEAFIPNPDNKPQINHKNGIKTDNRVSNLDWVSISENVKHSYHVLHRKKSMLGKFGVDNPNSKPILQLKNGKIIAKFNSAKEAERCTGISQGNISRCANKKTKSAGGYQWEYIK